jgi:hypothetical protein
MPNRRPRPTEDENAILTEIARWPAGLPLDVGVPTRKLDALAAEGVIDRRYVLTFRGAQQLGPLDREAYVVAQALPGKVELWIDGKGWIVPSRVKAEFNFLTHRLVSMTEQAARYHAELVALRAKVGQGDVRPLRRRRAAP